jgi:hypothetical protein
VGESDPLGGLEVEVVAAVGFEVKKGERGGGAGDVIELASQLDGRCGVVGLPEGVAIREVAEDEGVKGGV